ncbi:MAG: HAD-IB family phosphatase [Deltaproteobacteria bacterium]|nr:HAD-IB family phosphatase [Deltaproteobacteria bacterium]
MSDTKKTINLSSIGPDGPGLMATITGKILELNGNIIDVEENARRGLFSIFLVIDFSSSNLSREDIMDRLSGIETQTGLRVMLQAHEEAASTGSHQKEHHLVTVLGIDRPGIIAHISAFFHHHGINIETCKMVARGEFFSMEMIIDTRGMIRTAHKTHPEALSEMKRALKVLCHDMDQGVVIQSENIYNKMKKLVVFDVETTLLHGLPLEQFFERVSGKQADDGATLATHAAKLKGMPVSELDRFSRSLQLNPGAFEVIRILKSMGFKVALLSSGLDFFMQGILQEAGVDYAFSNTVEVDDSGNMTGRLLEPVITDETKDDILEFIRDSEGISRDQIIAVGDGSHRSPS